MSIYKAWRVAIFPDGELRAAAFSMRWCERLDYMATNPHDLMEPLEQIWLDISVLSPAARARLAILMMLPEEEAIEGTGEKISNRLMWVVEDS